MVRSRARVIIDNDFSGDPDDLFQLVHHLLSPAVEIPFIIGSHLSPADPFDPSSQQATNAVRVVGEVLTAMGLDGSVPVYKGSEVALSSPTEAIDTPAARAIIAEAMRDDTDLPLFVAVGGGLTELASALLLEPQIGGRMTVVWIGGVEHDGLAVTPADASRIEYNHNIDVAAGQTLFNHSTAEIWQCPRDIYRQCLVSRAELEERVRPKGAIGAYLVEAIDRVEQIHVEGLPGGVNLGETYALGDSPLVLLTALQAAFQADSSSSAHIVMPTPHLTADGQYETDPEGRPMRVYTRVDNRLMFEDLFIKLSMFAQGRRL